MYHQNIERGIHPELLQQFLARAGQRKLTQRALAKKIGVTEVQLSRMKRKDKDWRALTPEMSRKIMEVLNYRASQIKSVVAILERFKKSRTRRRHLSRKLGVSQIDVQCELTDTRSKHQAQLKLGRENSRKNVSLRIDCKSEKVLFHTDAGKIISGTEAALFLFPKGDGVSLMLAAIMLSLDDQWWKALVSNLDNLDTEASALLSQARTHALSGTWGLSQVVDRAKELFERHMDENTIAAA